MSLPAFKGMFEGQDRSFERRAMLNWATGAFKERLSSKVVMTGNAGFKHTGDILPAMHPDAKTAEDIFDENCSEEQLSRGRNKV